MKPKSSYRERQGQHCIGFIVPRFQSLYHTVSMVSCPIIYSYVFNIGLFSLLSIAPLGVSITSLQNFSQNSPSASFDSFRHFKFFLVVLFPYFAYIRIPPVEISIAFLCFLLNRIKSPKYDCLLLYLFLSFLGLMICQTLYDMAR